MEIFTYKYTGDKKKINKGDQIKEANIKHEFNAVWLEDTSIENPTMQIHNVYNNLLSVMDENYVYVRDFGRYYFVDDIIYRNGGIVDIQMSIDPLYSFHKDIEEADLFCIRCADKKYYNPNIPDNLMNIYAKKYITASNIGTIPRAKEGDYSIILTTSGG